MRTTFKKYKKSHGQIPETHYQNTTTQRPCYRQETKTVPHTEETPTHQPKSTDQTTQTRPTHQTSSQ